MKKYNFSQEDYDFLTSNIDTMKNIVINASCSRMTLRFRDGIIRIAKKFGRITCDTCNSSIVKATNYLYDKYLEDTQMRKEDIYEGHRDEATPAGGYTEKEEAAKPNTLANEAEATIEDVKTETDGTTEERTGDDTPTEKGTGTTTVTFGVTVDTTEEEVKEEETTPKTRTKRKSSASEA